MAAKRHKPEEIVSKLRQVDVLVGQGCNFVIGVDVSANIEHRVGDNFPNTPTERMKPPGVVTTLLRCFNIQAHNLSCIGAGPADVTIAPNVSMFASSALIQSSRSHSLK